MNLSNFKPDLEFHYPSDLEDGDHRWVIFLSPATGRREIIYDGHSELASLKCRAEWRVQSELEEIRAPRLQRNLDKINTYTSQMEMF